MEEAVFHENKKCIDNLCVECKVCNCWLQGHLMWEDHKIGKKHKRLLKGKPAKPAPKVIVPTGTVIIIEQTAIYNDAIQRYTLTLYKRGLLRSRLWSAAFSKKTRVRKFEHMLLGSSFADPPACLPGTGSGYPFQLPFQHVCAYISGYLRWHFIGNWSSAGTFNNKSLLNQCLSL